ncbi:MAG: FHA domain-containing protein [Myxococcota bacterium]
MNDDPIEDLPSPVAWATARCAPLEAPDAVSAGLAVRAFVELAVVRVLAEALAASRALPFTVESAMRLAMLDEMDPRRWLDLFAALESSGLSELLGLPTDLPPVLRDGMDGLGVAELVDWFDVAPRRAPGTVAPAINALTRAARGLYELPLHYVRRVTDEPDGAIVEHRKLVGTGWPTVRRSRHAAAALGVAVGGSLPAIRAGTVAFWDGESSAVAVPDWLVRWDDRRMTLWAFAGRQVTGSWRFEAWVGHGEPAAARATVTVADGACVPPPFLLSGASPSDPFLDDDAQTGLIRAERPSRSPETTARVDSGPIPRAPVLDTQVSTSPFRSPVASDGPPVARPRDGALALRVLTGVDLMRYIVLEPGVRVVLGRNAGTATFVLHHHQISRMHTEVVLGDDGTVTVSDLGSTNGTHVYGRALRRGQPQVVGPGTRIGVGPVQLRLEWLTPELRARLDQVLDLAKDVDSRDPHTQLLHPAAVADTLPRSLRPSFRDGGTARHAPPLWGILVYVDRLPAIHAQHGERVADRVFRDVARVLQYEVDSPGHWARVGYGELLLPRVGGEMDEVQQEAARLLEVLQGHPWEPPIERLTAIAAIGRKEPAEPAQTWLKRLRAELRDRRPRA